MLRGRSKSCVIDESSEIQAGPERRTPGHWNWFRCPSSRFRPIHARTEDHVRMGCICACLRAKSIGTCAGGRCPSRSGTRIPKATGRSPIRRVRAGCRRCSPLGGVGRRDGRISRRSPGMNGKSSSGHLPAACSRPISLSMAGGSARQTKTGSGIEAGDTARASGMGKNRSGTHRRRAEILAGRGTGLP